MTHVVGDESAYLESARGWPDELPRIRIADPAGFPERPVASAADLLRVVRLALENGVLAELSSVDRIEAGSWPTDRQEIIASTDLVLGSPGIDGPKTGPTSAAGHAALIRARAASQSQDVIVVIPGSPAEAQRTTDVTRLVAHAWATLETGR